MSIENVKTMKHWNITLDANNIAWVNLDKENAAVNTLSGEVMRELDTLLENFAVKTPAGVVFFSEKKTGFIMGADINEMAEVKTQGDAFRVVTMGQTIFDKIEALKCPTVALISGFCLGGGLELALACDYRIADDGQDTKLGLPEVQLGFLPGWGGIVRLPKLIGALKAMDLMLTGRMVSGVVASKMGFVDHAVPLRHFRRAAKMIILEKTRKHQPSFFEKLTNAAWVRPVLAKIMVKQTSAKASPKHYPAPFAIINSWKEKGVSRDAYAHSAKIFADLFDSAVSKNLRRVFHLQNGLKARAKKVEGFSPKHVHVVGAGVMGGDIAAFCALKGLTVTLQDRGPQYIAPALKRAGDLFKKKLKKSFLITAAFDRIEADVNGLGIKKADVIIEAIFENLEAKQALFKKIEKDAKPQAVLATNTSSIQLEKISEVLMKPERLVGIHFFNPVAKMMLVEVVRGEKTAEKEFNKAMAFVGKIGKLPVPVKSKSCFLVNRVLAPYMLEAGRLLDEGVQPELIDKTMKDFGMPMGPATLLDTVGLDIGLAVGKSYVAEFGGELPNRLKTLVDAGHLGVKTERGIYQYKKGKAEKQKIRFDGPREDIADRLILSYLNECVACLQEGITVDQDCIDAGLIFGTGFAPFTGGPIHYIFAEGVEKLKSKLENLAKTHGERFAPNPYWDELLNHKDQSIQVA